MTFLALLTEIMEFITLGVLLIVVGVGLGNYGKIQPSMRYFVFYLSFALTIEASAKFFIASGVTINNLSLLYPYLLVEFVLLSLMYRNLLKFMGKPPLKRGDIFSSILLVSIFTYCAYLIWKNGNQESPFDLYLRLIVHISILFYSFQFIPEILERKSSTNQNVKHFTTINNGILIYFTGTFVVFLLLNFVFKTSTSVGVSFLLINTLLSLIFYGLCIRSLSKTQPKLIG